MNVVGQLSFRVVTGAVLVMFLWAACFPLIRIGLADSPPMYFAALRAALSGAVLIFAAQVLHRPPVSGVPVWGGIGAVGLTATTGGFIGMFIGGSSVSPGLATVVANVQPLIAAVLAWLFLRERLSLLQQWGIAAGFAGIVLIGLPNVSGSANQLSGIGLILLAAVGIAISNVVLKRLAGRVDTLRAMGWQLLVGSVPLAMLGGLFEDYREIEWSTVFLTNLFLLSVLGTSVAFAIWFSLLRQASLNKLNVFTFLTPVFGLLTGFLFFGEVLTGFQISGIALGLLGIYAVSCSPAKSSAVKIRGASGDESDVR